MTAALTASTTYSITCTGTGGTATQSATVSVTAALPAITLAANPSTVNSGATSTLTWSATNATSCAATGGWGGTEPTSGSYTSPALSANASYSISCTGTGGTASQTVTVTVTGTTGTATLAWVAPTLNVDGTPITALSGYHIYYGTSPSALTQSATVSDATATTYTVSGLASGTWYFAVAADAVDGTESTQTAPVTKTI